MNRHILYILSGSQNYIAWLLLSSVNAHRCAYEFCQCISMCFWVCQWTFMCSWVLLVHICILMGCQCTSMCLWVLSVHIRGVMGPTRINTHSCYEFCYCTYVWLWVLSMHSIVIRN